MKAGASLDTQQCNQDGQDIPSHRICRFEKVVDSTACGHRMAYRKWKETKLQRSMLPGSAVPGCSLETGRTTQHVTGAPLPNFFGYSVPHPLSLLRLSSTDLGSCCEAKAILHTGVCCKRKVVSKRTYREVRFGEVGTFK